jgi:hypothetical protein
MQSIEQVVARGGLCALLFASGCESVGGLMVENHGKVPSAEVRVLGPTGKELAQTGTKVMLTFTGQPIQITLDGSHSSDADGDIVTYRWLAWKAEQQSVTDSGVDAGTVWSRADGGSPGWPDDIAQPTVTLGEGTHVFTLWVMDDSGNTSAPDSVRIDVQSTLSPEQCITSAVEGTDPVCVGCICALGDACREAVSASKCDAACWALIACIGEKCPDLQTRMACVPANCGEFLPPTAPAAALEGARGLGDMGANCFRPPCDEACQNRTP